LAEQLPAPDGDDPVYILGFAGGPNLAFSFDDNRLLDHDGPPKGQPPDGTVIRVHYQTITAPGSAGSPVRDRNWNVIALHHPCGMRERLNGRPGLYPRPCREGVWIQSIAHAARNDLSDPAVVIGPPHTYNAQSLPPEELRDFDSWMKKIDTQFEENCLGELIDIKELDR